MFINKLLNWALALVATFAVGCLAVSEAQAQTYRSGDYGVGEARRSAVAVEGVVIQVRSVVINVPSSTGARVTGGVVAASTCALLTRNVSDWTVRGAVSAACAAAGDRMVDTMAERSREAMEIIVRLSSGRVIAVTQEVDGELLTKGDAVYVIQGGTADRVVKA